MGLKVLIDNWKFSTFLFFIILQFLRLLRMVGFKTKNDPWRYTTRVYHHLDYCSFGLAAFNLRPPGIEKINDKQQIRGHIASQLASFLRLHPVIQKKLKWSKYSVKVLPNDFMDIILAEFNYENQLQSIQFFPDEVKSENTDPLLIKNLNKILIEKYNQLQFASDEKRPLLLKKAVLKRMIQTGSNKQKIKHFLGKMLSAVFIHFEPTSSDKFNISNRYKVPRFFQMRPFGYGSLNIHVRVLPENKVDLWLQFNHAVIDGEPAAEIIHDLENEWNTTPLIFPNTQLNQMNTDDCISYESRLKLCVASGILNFEKIMNYRRKLQMLFQEELDSTLTISGLILWGLGQTSPFKNTKLLVPISLPENSNHKKTVALLYIRPGKFTNSSTAKESFLAFQKEFNKQIKDTRVQKSEQYKVLEEFSILPHTLYRFSTNYLLKPLQEVVGSSVLTMLKKTSFFIAPYASTKTSAAIAFANISKTEKGNKRIGSVTIKGPSDKMEDYQKALIDVVRNYDKYISFCEE